MMMRILGNKVKILFFLVLFISTAKAQVIDSVFMNMPEKICPLLNQSIKFEMLEYFKAGQSDSVRNRLNGYSSIVLRDSMTKTIDFRASNSSDYQLKMFYVSENSYLVGLIRTVNSPILSSNIYFYDENWSPIEVSFVMPKISDWIDLDLLKKSNVDSLWLKKVDESEYFGMKFKRDNILEVTNNSLEILNKEDRKLVRSLLTEGNDSAINMNYQVKVSHDKIMIESIKK